MQTAVRKRAADFDFFGAIPPPRNFAKIRTRGGRGLQPVQPKDSIPPWGHAGTRRARRGGCAGVKRAAAHWRRCASAGAARAAFRRGGAGKAQCRAARRALPGARSRSLPSGRRREAGRGRACPREAHKGRVAGAAARSGHVGRVARRGRFAGLSGADAGKARRAAGAGQQCRGGCPLPGRGGRRRGQNGCTQRGLCRVSGHLCDRGGRRAKKHVFAL